MEFIPVIMLHSPDVSCEANEAAIRFHPTVAYVERFHWHSGRELEPAFFHMVGLEVVYHKTRVFALSMPFIVGHHRRKSQGTP